MDAGARLAGLAMACAIALTTGACSVSFPMASLFQSAEDVTGSIKPSPSPASPSSPLASAPAATAQLASLRPDPAAPLGEELGQEDWRRAKGALSVALDPQGNGAGVSWDNPDSRRRGRFTPMGDPFVLSDEICRSFVAGLEGPDGSRQIEGTACRPSGGEWSLREVKPAKKAA